jgi:thiopeptide-type bacteriocin biosynthesis protein
VQQLLKTQIVQAFFFVRYKDTDPHLRLRFRGNPHLEFYQYVVRATERALQQSIEAGIVYRVQVDTYQRELERYGTEHIDRCETLFHYDSLSTLSFLTQTGDVFDENTRFAFAVRKIDVLLTDAGLSVDACLTMITQLKESFFQEFGGRSELRQQLNEKYRTYRPLLTQALSEQFSVDEDVYDWRQQQAALLRQLGEAIGPGEAWQNILKSLVHMLINRLFPSKQRAYELVLYHCLTKHYDSVRARLQPKKS